MKQSLWGDAEFARKIADALTARITTGALPEDLEPGTHRITVRATDPYGQVWTGTKVFDVWADN